MEIKEVYSIQEGILEEIKGLQQKASQYDHYVFEHFLGLIKLKVTEEEMINEYHQIPESYMKFKVFAILNENGYLIQK